MNFQRTGSYPFAIFIIASVLRNFADVDFRIEVRSKCFMVVTRITVYNVQILNLIKKSGSWYSYNDTKLGQGRDAAKQCIMDNPELAEELEGLIFEELKKK
jgi:hypothetical protein